MALRTLVPEEWVPLPRTNISTRTARQPRDERARVPKSPHRGRPPPIKLLAPPPSSNDNNKQETISPRDPEIVDLAPPTTWPRRLQLPPVPPKQAPLLTRMNTPSLYSRHSTAGQSEISFGILDYYTRDPSPLQSPELPPPPLTPTPAPALKTERAVDRRGLEKFDFELVPCTPSVSELRDIGRKPLPISKGEEEDAVVGAVVEETPVKGTLSGCGEEVESSVAGAKVGVEQPALVNLTPPTRKAPDIPPHKRTYSLFPAAAVKETPSPQTMDIPSPSSILLVSPAESPTNKIIAQHHHQQPASSYRRRKESLTGSFHLPAVEPAYNPLTNSILHVVDGVGVDKPSDFFYDFYFCRDCFPTRTWWSSY
ncbi:hypothetical protein LTR78_009399 [Recurvomyces mirabilis]|uniref:Uncharacterized protein n=1 Tax=Recurvomyces mirabilis TaxID=574656 RepID=A0AAE0TRU6_9PEZI|nr:hypothetical protein LTR78_009399 [Recurvomyces mirabilis]KAK5154313.1 hypothetical protein LTS14_006998 [Recurvomyces mirabilis]